MATLKDVARESGLTVSTVSRVLNNRGYISDNARKRVEEAVKKLNYQPNELARSLQNKSTNTIALIVPHIRHPYFATVISAMEKKAYKNGYKLMVFNSRNREDLEDDFLEMCNRYRVSGIVYCCARAQGIEFSASKDIPVISWERYSEGTIASVECDNRFGGQLAARKLLECGCKNILLFGNVSSYEMPADHRSLGFMAECEGKDVNCYRELVDESVFNEMDYRKHIREVLLKHPETDGMFLFSDVIAAQMLQVLGEMEIKVPEQIQMISFDDSVLAEFTTPQLTAVHQPVSEMAEMAVQLITAFKEGKVVAKRTILPVTISNRGTTRN